MLKIGSQVSYTTGQKVKNRVEGIVVSFSTPVNSENTDLGCVEVWLSNQTGYGVNNCEHFHSSQYQEYLTLIKEPVLDNQFSVGKLFNTTLGKAVIVEEFEDRISLFLYCEDNTYNPVYQVRDFVDDFEIEEEDDFYEKFDEKLENEKHFNKETHCLHLLKSQLKDYLI